MIEGTVSLASLDVAIRTGFVAELSLMSVAVLVATRARTLAILELCLSFMAAGAGQLCMRSKSWKSELLVVDLSALERPT